MKARRPLNLPIALKLSASMALLVTISVLGFAVGMLHEERQHTEKEMLRVGRFVASTLAKQVSEATMRRDRGAMQTMLGALREDSTDTSAEHFIGYATILGPDGMPLASLPTTAPVAGRVDEKPGRSVAPRPDPTFTEIAVPIVYAGESVGSLRVGLSQYHRQEILDVVTTRAMWAAFALLVAANFCSVLLARRFARPLVKLADCAKKIGEGRWGATVAIESTDEVGELAVNLNEMSRRLESAFSEVREAQDQLIQAEKFSALGKLSSTLAHQLKNPLTSLKMIVEAAMAGKQGFDCTRHDGEVLLSEVQRMEHAVNDILGVVGERRLDRRPTDVNELIRQAVDAVRYRLDVAGIQLDLSLDGGMPVFPCDTDQLGQVFLNLILNAVEAMPNGGRLRIETAWSATAAQARVEIGDSGAGVPEAARSQIFDPFFTTKEKGSGLGLAVAYSVISEHGGRIALLSQESQGSRGATFVVTLPMREAEDAPYPRRG